MLYIMLFIILLMLYIIGNSQYVDSCRAIGANYLAFNVNLEYQIGYENTILWALLISLYLDLGVVGCIFIYLFICWSSRMTALLLCYHSIAPCTSKGGISASAIGHPWRFLFIFNI